MLANSPCPTLPALPMGVCEPQEHREIVPSPFDFAGSSCLVAKNIPIKEAQKNPAAKAALDKEWASLWAQRTWLQESVAEYDDVCNRATKAKKTVHFGRVFAICSLKGSELTEGDPGRKWKGRAVFQGNNVKDQDTNVALLQDMASSASSMIAGKFIDVISCLPGFTGMQADGQQAYTQSELGGNETWIFLPRDQWPAEWKNFKNPVCRLRLALMVTRCPAHFGKNAVHASFDQLVFSLFPHGTAASCIQN